MMTNINLPQLKPDSSIFSFYSKGNLLNSLNHENALTKVNEMVSHINLDQYSNVLNSVPIFYPSSFLGLLASISNRNYNVLPGSYKLDSIGKKLLWNWLIKRHQVEHDHILIILCKVLAE